MNDDLRRREVMMKHIWPNRAHCSCCKSILKHFKSATTLLKRFMMAWFKMENSNFLQMYGVPIFFVSLIQLDCWWPSGTHTHNIYCVRLYTKDNFRQEMRNFCMIRIRLFELRIESNVPSRWGVKVSLLSDEKFIIISFSRWTGAPGCLVRPFSSCFSMPQKWLLLRGLLLIPQVRLALGTAMGTRRERRRPGCLL